VYGADRAEDVAQEAMRIAVERGPASGPSLSDWAERLAEQRRVIDAVLGLDAAHRTVVILRYFEDAAPPEVARRLDVPLETVRTRLRRARERLRAALDDAHGGDRRRWVRALAPLGGGAWPEGLGWGPVLVGGLAVKKLLVVVGVVLALALGTWRVLHEDGVEHGTPATESAIERATDGATPERPTLTGEPTPAREAPAPTRAGPASLTLELRYPDFGAPALRLVVLSLRTAWDEGHAVAWYLGGRELPQPPGADRRPFGVERTPSSPTARLERVRISSLESREYTLVADVRTGGESVAVAVLRGLRLVDGENSVSLDLVLREEFAVLALHAYDGDDPLSVPITLTVDGTYWPTVSTDEQGAAEARVPGGSDVVAALGKFHGLGELVRPPEQAFRVMPRERRSVVFRIEGTVPVTFRGVDGQGKEVPLGGTSVWRLPPGDRPRYVGALQRPRPREERYRLPPGEYGVTAGGGGDFGPTWQRFSVAPGPPIRVTVPLSERGTRVALRLHEPPGMPTWNRSVLLARQGVDAPQDLAYATFTVGEDGRGLSAPLPDGEYLLQSWDFYRFRRVTVDRSAGAMEETLPSPLEASKQGSVRGKIHYEGPHPGAVTVRAEASGHEWGWMSLQDGHDGFRFPGLPAGDVVLRVVPSPWDAQAFRPYEATVRVVAGRETRHDVRLVP
jgi:hypothetical protein